MRKCAGDAQACTKSMICEAITGDKVHSMHKCAQIIPPLSSNLPQSPPMATPRKTASGTWRIQIEVRGQRDAGTFPTKREAQDWAEVRSLELKAAAKGGKAAAQLLGEARTLNDAMLKYKEEVSTKKRGWRWEFVRIDAITTKHPAWPGKRKMADLDAQDLIKWRDSRTKEVSDGTVLREMALIGGVLDVAHRDWGWLTKNPMTDVRKPSAPPHRDRIITGPEIRTMLREFDWSLDKPVVKTRQAVGCCFVLALQTGMRAGEIAGLSWDDVRETFCILHAGRTKTGKGRQVPLTPTARRIIEMMRGFDDEKVFGVEVSVLDATFRRYRDRAELSGFTFHDTRHTAATRMAQILHVLDLCKVFGWSNTGRALTYYNPSGADIAARLTAGARKSPSQ